MRHFILFISVLFLGASSGCGQSKQDDYLIKVFKGEHDEIGVECGYQNIEGDLVIPMGKYFYCYTDTLRDFAIVLDKQQKCVAINKKGDILYEVYWYDNGPDFISDGLFRIIKNDKIGYANEKGQIIIEPQFECAYPFENGQAKVALICNTQKVGEHSTMESKEWFIIDKQGKRIKEVQENQSLQGKYRSIKGVMDNLSCYCFNAGYLTTTDNKKIPICFEDDNIEIDCKSITVKGYYRTEKNNPESTNPCPSGEKTYFQVTSYSCD